MATTTNYGWTTPDDTALVKDGASAIRTLGSSVDTTTKALNPSTTLGDIEYRSSTANTNTRLGIGTTGQVLSVSGGVPAWSTVSSGGLTLLSTTTLSGATTTISSISQSYTSLYGVIYGVTYATDNGRLVLSPNGSATTSWSFNIETGGLDNRNADYIYFNVDPMLRTNANNAWAFQIDNYTSSANYKPFVNQGIFHSAAAGALRHHGAGGGIGSNTAITSLAFTTSFTGGNFSTGTVLLYGVK